MFVAGLSAGTEAGLGVFARTGVEPHQLDPGQLFEAMRRATLWPFRKILHVAERRLNRGDSTLPGKLATGASLVQGGCLLAQLGILGWAVYASARALSA